MNRSLLHILFFSFFLIQASGQEVILSRQLIGSSGGNLQVNEVNISQSVGEAVIGTIDNTQYIYTQGFHQPSNKSLDPISYSITVKNETCPDTKDGAITISNFQGCENGVYTIEWEIGETGNQLQNVSAGNYVFELSACGQVVIDTVNVGLVYENSCLLKFYTAFSPNNDGKNDVWEIDNIQAEVNAENEVRIVNRWGVEVNSYRNYNNDTVVWDGKNKNGNELTEGTYYYVVIIREREFTGYIELTR